MDKPTILKGNHDFFEVVEQLSETKFVVVRLTASTLKRDQRRKSDEFKSGYREGIIDVSKPTVEGLEVFQEGSIPICI